MYHFQQANTLSHGLFPVALLGVIGAIEGREIVNNWGPQDSNGMSWPKDDTIPGDLSFDPLGLCPADAERFRVMRTKELQNGRLAMIAITAFVAQELVDTRTIVDHLTGK